MSINTTLYDNAIQNAAEIRIAEEELFTQLDRLNRDHQSRLTKLIARNSSETDLLKEVNRYKSISKNTIESALDNLGVKELSFQKNTISNASKSFYKLKDVSREGFLNSIKNTPIRGNKNLTQQVNGIFSKQEERVKSVLTKNISSKSQLTAEIKNTSNLTRAQSHTLFATSSTQSQSEAFTKTMEANKDIIKGYRFTAVLDSRTSDICQHHDGEIYPVDDPKFIPPLHWNCRSVLVPVLKSHSELIGTDSNRIIYSVLEKMNVSSISRLDGLNPKLETYDVWLRRQPSEVQLKHLGNNLERLALFQNGNLHLKDFQSARGTNISAEVLARKAQEGLFDTPIRTTKYQPAVNSEFKVDAYKVENLIKDKKAQNQLKELFEIDERHSISPLSTTEFRGVTSETKRQNRFKSKTVADEDLIMDPVTGIVRNPLIYKPNNSLLEERLTLVRNSKILNKEQKEFIENFVNSMEDRVSTNNRSVITENLRVVFERQLNVDSPSYNKPWENLTAVIRAENVNAVQNVSRRLERTYRKDLKHMVIANVSGDADVMPSVNIFGNIRTFDQIENSIASNQRFVDDWIDRKGLKMATKVYFSGKAPLRNYFLPPSQINPLDFKKRIIKAYDEAIDTINVPARLKKYLKQQIEFWTQNPITVAENALIDFARELNVKWYQLVELEFFYRLVNINIRKSVVNNSPDIVKVNTRAIAKGLKALADGSTLDYDTLAINVGKALYAESKIDLPWRKPTLKDYHKNGSRILADLEKQGLIKIGQATVTRQSVIDVKTGRPDPSGYKEVQQREIEILDPDLFKLQQINRELYIGRRIGITQNKNRLYLDPPQEGKGAANIKYKDAQGKVTSERVITRSASAKLGTDEDAIGNQLDRDFQNQTNYANSLEWGLDNQFTDFFQDVVYYTPKDLKRVTNAPNLFREVVKRRGEQGTMFMQSMKWHRQKNTNWSNIHQFDGRGRFYEQGYLAATRGELVRPFLHTTFDQNGSNAIIIELKKQLGATIGDKNLSLSTTGRFQNFDDNIEDIFEIGSIIQGKYNQKQRSINEFLENKLIAHVDDISDAAEIGKIARYSLEIKRIEDHLNKSKLTLKSKKIEKGVVFQTWDASNKKHNFIMQKFKTRLLVENDASASGAQQIALASGDKLLADASNVIPTPQKQRLYDLAAQATVANPEFQKRFGPEGLNLGLDWEDLQKGAKAQNMVTFYGAGEATKTLSIESKFAKVLTKNEQNIVVYSDKAPDVPNAFSQKELYSAIETNINDAEARGLTNTVIGLKQVRDELDQVLKKEISIGDHLLRYASEKDDVVTEFVMKSTNTRAKLITPKDFEFINRVMSEELSKIAPSTERFITFWKAAARTYVNVSGTVDIPWVNYRGKQFTQFYRPISEDSISFKDPITGKIISNSYRNSVDDGLLRSSGSAGDAQTGLGVNGNHSNDASLVQGYWLKAKSEKKRVATIHDGFFSPIEDADWTIDTLYNLMGDAVESNSIKKTLISMRDFAKTNVNRETRREQAKILDSLLDKAEANILTREDISNAFKTLPGLREYIKKQAKLTDYELNKKLGNAQKQAILNDLASNVTDEFYSVKTLKDSMSDILLLEKTLNKEFNLSTNQILNQYAKHGTKRRLLITQNKYKEGTLNNGLFFNQYFKEPALTPQETSKYRDAVKKATAQKKAIPYVAEVLGKKPTQNELLRKQYNVSNLKNLEDKIKSGNFTFENFFKNELIKTENPLDLKVLKEVIKNVSNSQNPDINITDIIASVKSYRGNLRSVQRKQLKEIDSWYESMLAEATRAQLIDKNKTNKLILQKVDNWQTSLNLKKFNYKQLPSFYRDWSEDLEKYFGIKSLAELNIKYRSGNFDIEDFIRIQDNRYRELKKSDIIKKPLENEDRYGIGP